MDEDTGKICLATWEIQNDRIKRLVIAYEPNFYLEPCSRVLSRKRGIRCGVQFDHGGFVLFNESHVGELAGMLDRPMV